MSDVRPIPDYELEPSVRADTPTQLKALADPVRISILHLVLERAATTTELAEALGRPKGTIDHHLKVLEAAGLMRVVRTRQVRTMTERFWGRTGRTIFIDDPPGELPTCSRFLREAMDAEVPGEHGFATLRYARIPVERVVEFEQRLDQLALEFIDSERGGDTVFGLVLGLFPTSQPVLAHVDELVDDGDSVDERGDRRG